MEIILTAIPTDLKKTTLAVANLLYVTRKTKLKLIFPAPVKL